MKIKTALLSHNDSFGKRLADRLQFRYSQDIEMYLFSDFDLAIPVIQENRLEILLADEDCPVDEARLPKKCLLIYLSDIEGIASVRNHPAIFRFQNVDQIYKQMLYIYAESANNLAKIRIGTSDRTRIILFSSPCGGVGNTCMAAACAQYFVNRGSSTIYINLEEYGSADLFFSGAGQFDLSDVIYAVKSKKGNLQLKLESYVKTDGSGVSFFSPPKNALDLTEMKSDEYIELLTILESLGKFDYLIVDADFSIHDDWLSLARQAHSWVMVTDGTSSANQKTARAYKALVIKDQNADIPILNKMFLAYNRFTIGVSQYLTEVKLEELGSCPAQNNTDQKKVIGSLAGMTWFERLR